MTALIARGADPFVGRRLRGIFAEAGLEAEVGVHQGVWPVDRAAREAEFELGMVPEAERDAVRDALESAIMDRSLLQYNPVFYALAKK